MAISSRIRAAEAAFAAVHNFYNSSRYSERRLDPGISDFTFGNPHEMPLAGLVAAIREHAQPHDKNWFAYKSSESEPQAFVAEHLGRELGLAFEPADIALTTGALPQFWWRSTTCWTPATKQYFLNRRDSVMNRCCLPRLRRRAK